MTHQRPTLTPDETYLRMQYMTWGMEHAEDVFRHGIISRLPGPIDDSLRRKDIDAFLADRRHLTAVQSAARELLARVGDLLADSRGHLPEPDFLDAESERLYLALNALDGIPLAPYVPEVAKEVRV
ncbi:MAG TPA: hypothetical protein VMW24_06050 [Sedimentisphaerales bacterium]|nr:hypothetical protein [Sedimentisphaerales bacterium]